MEREREMTGHKSDPTYNGEGFRRDGQEETAVPQPELVRQGEFLTDKKAMERIVDEELAKIVGEQLLPYNLYLRNSAKTLGLCLSGLILSIAGLIGSFASTAKLPEVLVILIMVSSFFGICGAIFGLIITTPSHYFLLHPLYKLYRAKKIFGQVMEELLSEALNGKVEIKNLKEEFDLKVEDILNREYQKEEAERAQRAKKEENTKKKQNLIEQAKNSKL